jgi:arylsulfatase A-like enzyme
MLKSLLLVVTAGLAALPAAAAESGSKPNVVYLLADDLGWSDLSTHPGGSIPTPRIDRLFEQGVQLKNFMGWCVCSPTRAMLLTARHSYRVGTGPETGGELAKEEVTIAEAFKANGYRTGIFGKWHNGGDPGTPEFQAAYSEAFKDQPNKGAYKGGFGVNAHGFDEAWVYYGGGADYFTRRIAAGKGPVSWWHNLEYRSNDQGYTEDLIVQHAMDFIRDNKDRPFFCYVPFHIVHGPLAAKDSDLALADKDLDANTNATNKNKRIYAAMVQAMDRNVAAILAELEQLGLSSNTIVVFTSDNGATLNGCNLPFRGGKHTLYEGGTHLPTVVYWPKGGLVSGHWDGLCGALDMFPTLVAMAGLEMPKTRPLDGKNIWPALRDRTASPVESYYWSWHKEDAIRTADWRLHRYWDHSELYDIHNDIGETKDVAAAHPDVVKSLTAKMNAWAESLGAALTHQPVPAKLAAPPAPEGDVLKVSVTVTEKAKPKDQLFVQLGVYEHNLFATDYFEYDLAIGADSLREGFFLTPYKGNNSKEYDPVFKRGEGIDQLGREQALGTTVKGGPGVWEHRIIGLSSAAPGNRPRQGFVFRGGKPGTYTVYLDNLRIRHADGSTTPIWTCGKDTKHPKIADCDLFKDVRVGVQPAGSVGKGS